MKRILAISLVVLLLLGIMIGTLSAQEPGQTRGTIMGVVYEDVNGDGKCVNTGVAGEGPVANVDVQFTSSDEKTILTMFSSDSGGFGLFSTGYSYWRLTAKPSAEWVVTSQNPIHVPIFADTPSASGLFFCVQKAAKARVVLPVSGGAMGSGGLLVTAVSGITLLFSGLLLEIRRRR